MFKGKPRLFEKLLPFKSFNLLKNKILTINNNINNNTNNQNIKRKSNNI